MVRTGLLKPLTLMLASVLLATSVLLVGCMEGQGSSSEDPAATNRAYMASLNRQMADLAHELEGFQEALADSDAVTMQAKLAAASRIVDAVASTEAPERLAELKDSYSSALEQLQKCLQDYTSLYSQMGAGSVTTSQYAEQLEAIQESYDAAIEVLRAADERAVAISKE